MAIQGVVAGLNVCMKGEGMLALSVHAGDDPYIVFGVLGKGNRFSIYVYFQSKDFAYEIFWNANVDISYCT
jgi:hypothetical protein